MTDIGAGETILGCPLASFTSLEAACSLTNAPPCVTVSAPVYNEACCSSITSFGLSLAACFETHAPTCLDTSAFQASLTGGTGVTATNPCAAYANGGAGGGGGSAPSTTAAPSAPSSAAAGSESSAAPTTAAPTSAAAGGSSAPAGTDTAATPSATASKSGSQRQQTVGAGLKVYIGVALIGALAVLSL